MNCGVQEPAAGWDRPGLHSGQGAYHLYHPGTVQVPVQLLNYVTVDDIGRYIPVYTLQLLYTPSFLLPSPPCLLPCPYSMLTVILNFDLVYIDKQSKVFAQNLTGLLPHRYFFDVLMQSW
jgi:hypothetical protein